MLSVWPMFYSFLECHSLEEYPDKMAGFVFSCLGERLGRDAFESSEGEQTGIGDLEC